MSMLARLLSAITLCLALAIPASAAGSALTPLPMRYFCAHNPDECIAYRADKAKWNDELHTLLQAVNSQVNSSIRPQANPRGGWKVNPRSGDCNDYALTKRSRLIAMGVPGGALRLAVTRTARGEKHLILIVKTTGGDVVLDNLSRTVRTLAETGYPVYSMSGANPTRWTAS